jgi:hypothetical protein
MFMMSLNRFDEQMYGREPIPIELPLTSDLPKRRKLTPVKAKPDRPEEK